MFFVGSHLAVSQTPEGQGGGCKKKISLSVKKRSETIGGSARGEDGGNFPYRPLSYTVAVCNFFPAQNKIREKEERGGVGGVDRVVAGRRWK